MTPLPSIGLEWQILCVQQDLDTHPPVPIGSTTIIYVYIQGKLALGPV